MERTKKPLASRLQTMATVALERIKLAARMGQQYGGDRNIYQSLGYPVEISYSDYLAKYIRQDMAKAIIDRPVTATWQGELGILESSDDEETALEKDWEELNKELGLKNKFARLDKLTGLGKYGVLLLGLNDTRVSQDFEQPVTTGAKKLLYVKPFSEASAVIKKYVSDPADPRYGLPEFYDITIVDAESARESTVKVHYTRVMHVVGDSLESEVKGLPRLEVVYNRLMDLEKLVGGDAEMFWRGARPGYTGKLDPDFQMTDDDKDDLQNQMAEFEHNLLRVMVNEGVELKSLAQQIADPSKHVDVQIQMISAVTGIPKRILTGSERGELSSAQDKTEWLTYVQSRREEFAGPYIMRPFIDICIKYGILPEAKEEEGYNIKWQDLFALNEAERTEIGKGRAESLGKYAASPMAELMIPPEAFLEFVWGLSKEEIELIGEMRDAAELLEPPVTEEEEEIVAEEGEE